MIEQAGLLLDRNLFLAVLERKKEENNQRVQ